MPKLYTILNALALAFYGAGHAAVSAFLTNTRIIGIRDSRFKQPLIVANLVGLPVAGLAFVMRTGGLDQFLASFARPFSWRWYWRVGFTLWGLRQFLQEIYRTQHRNPCPPEVLSSETHTLDMRREVARAGGGEWRGLKGVLYDINDIYRLEVNTHEVRLDRLPPAFDGFTIAQLSDIHYGDFMSAEYVRRYLRMCIEMNPDLIVLTGDYQQYHRDLGRVAKLLAPIGEWSQRERCGQGALAILGNHDTWSGSVDVTQALREAGIKVLSNEHVRFERDGQSLYVAGVADPWAGRADLQRTLHGVPEGSCTILLAHVPDYIIEASLADVDLQLSGHIHAGQIKLPFLGALLSPSRYGRRYIQGFYKRDDTLMYVSSGLGGHPPVRLWCKPEVALFRLRERR